MPNQKNTKINITNRSKILSEIKKLGKMRDASLSKQEYKKPGGKNLGPYYLLQGYNEKGEHYSQRIPEDMVPAIQKEIENFKKFERLTKQLSNKDIDKDFFENKDQSDKKDQ